MSALSHLNPVAVRLSLEALPRRERELVAHLLSCAACRTAVALADLAPLPEAASGRSEENAYDQVFARGLDRAQEQWAVAEEERRQAGLLFEELWSLPRSRWREVFAQPCPVAFLTLVLERAFECAVTDPRTCQRLALLVRSAARRRHDLPGVVRNELIGHSWTVAGHAHALHREWQPADAALARASQLLASCPNPMTEAELCRVLAERHLGRGSSGEALALLARAARLAGEIGDVEQEVCDLVRQAGILWEVVADGRTPAAVIGNNDIAQLVAAAIPALSRQLVELGGPTDGEGSENARTLIAVDGEEALGYLDTILPDDLTSYVNLLEYLRRSPLDLARLMYAARGSSLRRAGAILWLWEQAPR